MDKKKERQLLRYQNFFQILDEWMTLRENGNDIDCILYDAGYKRIAIYGMGRLCRHICNSLANSKVEVAYIIDEKSLELYGNFHVVDLNHDFEEVDAVICTDDVNIDIRNILMTRLSCKIISLADVVFDNVPERNEGRRNVK